MDIEQFYGNDPNEQPLDRMVADGFYPAAQRDAVAFAETLSDVRAAVEGGVRA